MGFIISRPHRGPWWLAACLSTLLSAWVGCRHAAAAEPGKTILLVGHTRDGHAYESHMYMAECRLLARCLEQTPGIKTRISNRWPRDDAQTENIASIALYVPVGAQILFGGPQRDRVKQLLASGVGLAAVHWSTGADGEEMGHLWLDSLGAWFSRDFSPIEHIEKSLVQADQAHPIGRGWKHFTMFDEYYWDLRFAPTTRPLVTVEHQGRTQVIGWTFERPHHHGGRSFGTVAGHYHKSFENDSFRQAVVNGILWTAGVEIPAAGAPCQLTAQERALPPMDVLD